MEQMKLAMLDDHPIMLDGLMQLLEGNERFEVIAQCTTYEQLMEVLGGACDILILDLNIRGKDSLKKLEEIRFRKPRLKVLIFSSYHQPSTIKRSADAGVEGYLLKDTDREELLRALNTIADGGTYFVGGKARPAHSANLVNKKTNFEDVFVKTYKLTSREEEVMRAIVEGLENQAIADRMFISIHTVQTHRKRIFKKLGVHSATELVKMLLEQKQNY